MSEDANALVREYEWLWGQQANFRTLWNTIAQYVMPAWDNFVGYTSEGTNRTTRLFDAHAITANERFAAIMESLLTPRTQFWHDLAPSDEELKDDAEVQAYCSTLRALLFRARYRPGANYASSSGECYLSIGAFGNTAMYVEDRTGKHILYRSIPLNEIVWSLNAAGMVDNVYRRFRYTAKQCMQMQASDGWMLSDVIKRAYEKSPYTEFDILHCVKPNEGYSRGSLGERGKAFSSWYVQPGGTEHTMLKVGGYRTFPYAIGRYRMAPREHYGRSPGSVALPAIRTLNEQKKTALRAGQKAVDPPLLLADEGALTPFNLRAGALNYGMLSSDGTPLVQALESKAKFDIGAELMEMERQAIDDPFLTSVLQILAQHPDMTATEALIRSQEKGILVAPAMGRQQSEFLGPQIHRELDILDTAGVLPPMPLQLRERGGLSALGVEYTSPLAKLLRAEEAQTIMTSVQGISQMAAVKPQILDLIDWDETGRDYLESTGFPGKLLLDADKIAEIRKQAAAEAQGQQIAAAAPDVSKAALNLAQAHQALTASPAGASPQ